MGKNKDNIHLTVQFIIYASKQYSHIYYNDYDSKNVSEPN